MVYTDNCPVLSDTEWRDNCQFPIICNGETLSDWMKRIWDQLMNYKNMLSYCEKDGVFI
ncbi:19611_t:CDS:2 [Gigaspora margarita]|uniref:19611_t:CDS:1 n=1 Tax=Gigaspora margarita TaxID=4874 RepID=A0ABN7VHI6_GIGMA|nr:19611_t:CDS:2 [Gigaspora margarita]